ncbi:MULTISPECIES: type IV toxin-antitoxin system AbiEi family antitoxin domain-containing protein [Gammaproteobacteria]|uniref:type IV toxin-antitoxin system AbiEi family antitoxin domain-containing protein n=1 Tax=Gammaproteobacteria TaxID=1236 RepID=UPI000DD0231D|nr:type IV toxin-antitoxin system AbiEi family antitoxin domain-containing protein [Lysobacter sp. N42]RTE86573.1 transcriptional regulator [Aliidiomarina sp. B3213]TCZ90872.1 transcriptional regulator [Lysobacter sp. N42]
MKTKEQVILEALEKGPMRTSELEILGVSRATITRLTQNGSIERIARGLYQKPAAEFDENQQLVEVCKQVPRGVICLLSALQFYNISTELPFQTWLAIEGKSRAPAINYPPIRICRFTGESYHKGIEEVPTASGVIRIYSPAKTVADCFKYRNKIGKDVAIMALKDCYEQRLATINELNHFANICRVNRVMRPYMEVLAHG